MLIYHIFGENARRDGDIYAFELTFAMVYGIIYDIIFQKLFISDNFGVKKIKLYELDRLKSYDYSTCLYIPSIPLVEKERFDFNDLLKILEILRAPNGCPWDREQTEKTILKNVIEEAYELVDAVNQGDDGMIVEETGDLILQSAFYMLFGEEDIFDGS